MARSGYPLDGLLVGGDLELVGGHVTKGAVQPGAVVPGDVLHGGAAGGGPGGPGLLVFDRQASIFVKVPQGWTLSNFVNLFVNEDGLRLILNSLIYSGGATLVLVVVATMAGYVLSRYHFPGRRTFMLGILLLRVILPTAIIAPLYVIATGLGFLNTYYGVTLGPGLLAAPPGPLADEGVL